MSDTSTTGEPATTTAPPSTREALDDIMKNMRDLAFFMRRLLDDAAAIITTAMAEREEGLDVGIALNHAQLLLSQIERTCPQFDRLAESVRALYGRRSDHWTHTYGVMPMSEHVYPDIHDRIELLRIRLATARVMDAGVPETGSPEAYRRLIRYHDIGRIHVWGLAREDTAPPSLRAAEILHMHYTMMCCIMNGHLVRDGSRWAIQAMVDWINWTGWSFHNMAEMTTGKHDRWHPEFFVSECRSFVEAARTKPVPADWHPSSSRGNDSPGYTWKQLCDFVALQAGMEPAYGVPVKPRQDKVDVPPCPEPPRPIMGLHTAGSLERYSYRVREWCHEWARVQLATISFWPPSSTSKTLETS